MSLLRKTLVLLPGNVLGPLIQLGTIVVLTHWLEPAALGIYALIVAFQDLVQIATLSWWSQYVLRYLDENRTSLREQQDRTEIGVIVMAAASQIVFITALMMATPGVPLDLALVVSAVLASIARTLMVHWAVRARAAQQMGLYSFAQISGPALSLALSLAGFVVFGTTLTVAFLAMALGHVLAALPMGRMLTYRRIAGGIDRATLVTAFRYGAFTALGTVLAWISMQSIRFIINYLLGATAVGLIFVGWGIGQRVATQVSVLATSAFFPMAASRARNEGMAAGVQQLMIAGPVLLAILAPATIGIFYVAEPLSRLVTALEYQVATAAILPIAMLAGAVRAFRNHFLDEILQLTERPHHMAAIDAVEAVATVILCSLGAFFHGVEGAVIGCLIAAGIATLLALVLITRNHGAPIRTRAVIKTVAACLFMVAVLTLVPVRQGLPGLLLLSCAGCAAYLAAWAALEFRTIWHKANHARRSSTSPRPKSPG